MSVIGVYTPLCDERYGQTDPIAWFTTWKFLNLSCVSLTQYSKNKAQLIDNAYFRLYIKDGNREVEVFPYGQINKTFDENYFLIDTTVLIPQRYYIDIKVEYNRDIIISKQVLEFNIVNEI